MNELSGMALCSIKELKWNGSDGKVYVGILLIPVAGKIPRERILYIPFVKEMENASDGECYLMSFHEVKFHKHLSRYFQWASAGHVQDSDLPMFMKELGRPAIFNEDNRAFLKYNEEDLLAEEKIRFETERKYFKRKAHIRHLKQELDALNIKISCDNSDDSPELDIFYHKRRIDTIKSKILEICSEINL